MPPENGGSDQWGSAPALSVVPASPHHAEQKQTATAPHTARTQTQAERYGQGGTLGAGGMGVVAVSRDGLLQREVARKSVRPDLTTAERRERLLREARIAARLEHPAIVPVYDAGVGEDGEPWYAMRLVRGQTLQAALQARPKLADRLLLMRHFLAACEGMAYAHQLGVVHRDLKPDNILVGELGETQIADWGLARVGGDVPPADANAALTGLPAGAAAKHLTPDDGDWTQAGTLLGTPQYASPEAARGEEVGPAGDVFSLGAVLWTLLSGRRPWDELPVSQVLARTRDGTPLPTPVDAPQELVAIVQHAMAPLPSQRYPTARELAEEVARWLDGRRVHAHTYTRRELLQRVVRAWRWQLLAAAVALVSIALAVGVATAKVVAERNRALAAEATAAQSLAASRRSEASLLVGEARSAAEADRWPVVDLLARAALERDDTPAGRGLLAAAAGWSAPALVQRRPLPACPRWLLPAVDVLLCVQDDATERWQPGAAGPAWRVPLAAALAAVRPGAMTVELVSQRGELWSVQLDNGAKRSTQALQTSLRQLVAVDAHWLLGGGGVGLFRWDARSASAVAERESLEQEGEVPRQVRAVAADSARERVMLVVEDQLQVVRADGAQRNTVRLDPRLPWASVASAACSPDGQQLAIGTTTGELYVVGLDGRVRGQASAGTGMIRSMHWQGTLLAVREDEPYVHLFAADPLARVVSWPLPDHAAFALTADGQLVLAGTSHEVWRWSSPPASPIMDLGQGIGLAGISGGYGQLLVPDADGRLVRLSLSDGQVLQRLQLPQAVVKSAVLAGAGGLLAVTDPAGRGALVYRLSSGEVPLRLGNDRLRRLAVLRDPAGGEALLQAPMGGLLGAASLPDGATLAVEPALFGEWADLAIGPSGRRALAVEAHAARLVLAERPDALGPVRLTTVATLPGVSVAALHPDDATLAAAREASWTALRADGAVLQPAVTANARILDLTWSPDGRWLAAAELDGAVEVWRWPEATLALQMKGHTQRSSGVYWEPNGTYLWSASWDGTVRRWGVAAALGAGRDALAEQEALWGSRWRQWLPSRGM